MELFGKVAYSKAEVPFWCRPLLGALLTFRSGIRLEEPVFRGPEDEVLDFGCRLLLRRVTQLPRQVPSGPATA